MGPINCPETSARNYHYSMQNSPEERCCQDLTRLEFDGLLGCSPKQERAQNKLIISTESKQAAVFLTSHM